MPDISSRSLTLNELFLLGRFVPAAVQREYQWNKENCQLLLADLKAVARLDSLQEEPGIEDDGHHERPDAVEVPDEDDTTNLDLTPTLDESPIPVLFLGTVVLRPDGDHYEIYDGLQRLTTLIILLALLRDKLPRGELKDHLARLVRLDNRSRLEVKLGGHLLEKRVLSPGCSLTSRWPNELNLSPPEARLKAVTAELRAQIQRWTIAQTAMFASNVLQNARFSAIEISDPRVARHVFVSTNLYGKRLDRTDVLKGQLMELAADEAHASQIADAWGRLVNRLKDDLDSFLVAVDVIERRIEQSIDCLSQLGVSVAELHGPNGLLNWLERLHGYADAWTELHFKLSEQGENPVDIDIWKLGFLEWSEWKPLALLWYRDMMNKRRPDGSIHAASRRLFEARFFALHRRCIGITAYGYPADDRAKIFMKALRARNPFKATAGEKADGALHFFAGTMRKIEQELRVPITDDSVRRTLVRWIEASLWKDQRPPSYITKATVEHVLPKGVLPPGSRWLTEFPDPEQRYDAAHSLGNLVALDASSNRAAENSDFPDQLNVYRRAMKFQSLDQAAKEHAWNFAVIKQREDSLAEFILSEIGRSL